MQQNGSSRPNINRDISSAPVDVNQPFEYSLAFAAKVLQQTKDIGQHKTSNINMNIQKNRPSYNPMLDLTSRIPTPAELNATRFDAFGSFFPESNHQTLIQKLQNSFHPPPPGNSNGYINSVLGTGTPALPNYASPMSSPSLGPQSMSHSAALLTRRNPFRLSQDFELTGLTNSFPAPSPIVNHRSSISLSDFPQPSYPLLDPHTTMAQPQKSHELLSNNVNLFSKHSTENHLAKRKQSFDDGKKTETLTKRRASSSYRGVSWKKDRNAWAASIMVNGKYEHLGYFDNEEEAAREWDKRALELRGRAIQLNFPSDKQEFATIVPSEGLNVEKTTADNTSHSTAKTKQKTATTTSKKKKSSKHVKPKAARTSKYRGVIWDKNSRAWRAKLSVNGKLEHIGLFDVEEEAAKAWDLRALAVRGKIFTKKLNFPDFAAYVEEQGVHVVHFESQRVRGGSRSYGNTGQLHPAPFAPPLLPGMERQIMRHNHAQESEKQNSFNDTFDTREMDGISALVSSSMVGN